MTPSTIPLFPALRHARLSAAHARALFGDRTFDIVHTLGCGDDVSDRFVDVEVGIGRLERVRVLLPFVARTFVALASREARALGLAGPLPMTPSGGPACTLHGPEGVVVVVDGVVAAERIELPGANAGEPALADVVVDGERPRTFRRLPVVPGDMLRAFVVDDVDALAPRGRLVPAG